MDTVDISLQDPETNQVYTIKVSSADVVRAQNDAFQHVLPGPSSSPSNNGFTNEKICDTEVDAVDSYDQNMNEESVGENFRWSHEAVLLLIDEYTTREKSMSTGKMSHKKAWDEISEAMNAKGYSFTGKQCSTRLNTMKRTYKAVKDHNGKSGNSTRTCPYYEIMENLFGSKPYMAPLSTISSTGTEISNCRSSNSSSSSISLDGNCHVSRQRRTTDVATTEETKERRHREKMELGMKLMDKLDKLLEKL
ncbi:uncharacterized protein LOC120358453 isoform X2 [Solenopsis invicta]|uniref:uncharacterized protein LOC120358453 isoform X2 n=1 Tax=Solenopsis invicta TaxID=13686 RepID=UPI00193EC174|nr:uncharacterized protein LOC120358453 isoform X2 [Solenopsis invicta]